MQLGQLWPGQSSLAETYKTRVFLELRNISRHADRSRTACAPPHARTDLSASPPPCIDFSIAGGQRGTDGNTDQLFLDDAEGALETDAPIVISEIVLGILDETLITFLRQKVDRLRQRYVACWRVLQCNRRGGKFTNRRRIFIVGIKAKYLRAGLFADPLDLFPPDRPADVSPGLGDIIDPSSHNDAALCFTELDRLRWLPPRELPIGYDGLRLVAYGKS